MVRPHDSTPLPDAGPAEDGVETYGAAPGNGRRDSFEVNETSRVETFSDSVFAIAATLLVLTLHVPSTHSSDAALWHQLIVRWPTDVAFVISFLSILIIWSNHHGEFNVIQRVDHTFLLLNGTLLLGITATPFTTTLLAANLGHASERVGALIYSGALLFVSLAFVALWLYASRGRRLLTPGITSAHIGAVTRQFAFGPAAFALAFALAFASAKLSVAMLVAIEVFYAIPSRVTRTITPD